MRVVGIHDVMSDGMQEHVKMKAEGNKAGSRKIVSFSI